MRSVYVFAAAAALASAFCPRVCLAQAEDVDWTGREPNPEANDFAGSGGDESPELRALRLAERDMFGGGQALVETPAGPELHVGTPPPAFTSDVPEDSERPAEVSRELGWLEGLTLPDIPIRWDDQVIRYLEFYRDDPRGRNIMGAWLRRATRYGDAVRAELRALGLPEDLLYVAMIESGFDPAARSRAAAVGMWQFVGPTGEEYGLDVTHWVDERMDPVEATQAAGRYLRDLHARFGSWELAFAAYNMGYGALLRAIRKYNTNDYWVLSRLEAGLPFETTFYVAKVMACAIVGRNPERFGFEGIEPEAPFEYDEVEVPGGTPFGRIARAAGVDRETLEALNPHLGRQRVPPGEPRTVRIPKGQRERFAETWTRMQPRHPAHKPYVVRFGESLEDIADRFRTTEAALRTLNELEDGARVGAGLELLVPAVEPRDETPEEAPVVAVPQEVSAPAGARRVFYRVGPNDSAEEIAGFFRVSVDDLRRWNHVDPAATLHEGMFLQLFVPPEFDLSRAVVLAEDAVQVLVVGSDAFFDYHEEQQGRVRFRYTVREGDSLTSIGERFGLSVGSLARINRFSRRTLLQVGQEIIVYADPRAVPRALLEEQERARAEAEPDAPGSSDPEDPEGGEETEAAEPDDDGVTERPGTEPPEA